MSQQDFYRKLIKAHQDDVASLGWGSKESQEIRFRVLCGIGNMTGKKLLDVGCGFGDLYGLLKDVDYTGYDNVPEMLQTARRRFPVARFVDNFPEEGFDYIVESGIFNLKETDWTVKTGEVLWRMYGWSKIGVAANFLSAYTPTQRKEGLYYADPKEIIKLISGMTNKWVLRHDYKENDFTIYLYH